jgi:hypothetical protein
MCDCEHERSGPSDESIFGRQPRDLDALIEELRDHPDFNGVILTREEATAAYEMIGEYTTLVDGAPSYQSRERLAKELERINNARYPLL